MLLRIATRKSPLALWQANFVKQQLQNLHPNLSIELLGYTTEGDNLLSSSLAKVGGKGLFVKELEKALLEDKADIAVHSMKDVPMDFPPGLQLGAICKREDPHDVFLSNQYETLFDLPDKATVGTSSLRRQAQVLALRPDLRIEVLRGNINTRIDRLDKGDFDAIILAAAGLLRLNMQNRIRSYLPFLPAVGQGALGIECRSDDKKILEWLEPLNDPISYICVSAERAMSKGLGASCQVPVGGYATVSENLIILQGLVAKPDGSLLLQTQQQGNAKDAEKIGKLAAEDLLTQGAGDILADLL